MQDRYAGDVGDFVKFAILRGLASNLRVGVAWWLFPDEDHNRDGRHVDYLDRPDKWRRFDPALFDILTGVVKSGKRGVRALEDASVLPGASFASEVLPVSVEPRLRPALREAWVERAIRALDGCDLVFLDPDNGLEPKSFIPTRREAGKSIAYSELVRFRRKSRTLVVYHHQTRRQGGHIAEIDYLATRLKGHGFNRVDTIRARPYSPRAFFILDSPTEIRALAKSMTEKWAGHLTFHPDTVTSWPANTANTHA